jgi:subtilisin family serine protease
VAGTIGALNNGAGVVGVAPGTPIFALRVLDSRGSGAFSNIINALLWVAENGRAKGIRVINMSLGGDGGADPTSSAVCDAVKAVADAGIAVVAAAGNGGGGIGPRSWTSQLPVACPYTIAVTAIDSASNPAVFSYFLSGPEAAKNEAAKKRTVAAPGVDVKSTWPRDLGVSYRSISGTSMARWVSRAALGGFGRLWAVIEGSGGLRAWLVLMLAWVCWPVPAGANASRGG